MARKVNLRSQDIPIKNEAGEHVGYVASARLEIVMHDETGFPTLVIREVELASIEEAPALALAYSADTTPADAIEVVWRVYVDVMQPRSKMLGPQERKIIREALVVATADECALAIRGCRASAFHMGENDRGRKYNRISQILKGRSGSGSLAPRTTRETIDFFIDLHAKSGSGARGSSASAARLRGRKQDVRDALEFPGDETVVARGREAKAWLESQGIEVQIEGSRATFVEPPRT